MSFGNHALNLPHLEHAIRSHNTDVLRHAFDPRPRHITPRSAGSSCYNVQDHEIIISRTALISAITVCSIVTIFNIIILATLSYRQWRSRRQFREAKSWGRQSLYHHHQDSRRLSYAKKAVDDSYTQRYRGVLESVVENPEMSSDDPAGRGLGRRGEVWEVQGDETERERLRLQVVDVDGMEDVELESATRRLEIVDGQVREKGGAGRKENDKMKRKSLFWVEGKGGGVWLPRR